MNLHRKKYQNTILYLCRALGGELHGKKKLAKLLYFVDFDFYEKNQKSITGDIYRALPMGSFPVALEKITKEMEKEKLLEVKQEEKHNGYNPTEIYVCSKNPDLTVFSKEELKMLNRIVLKYGQLNGKQLENLSHAEAPYIGTELKNDIPYELAFYRGTDFSDI